MWLMYWVVVVFGPHSGLVWTSTIVGWGGLIWLIGVIDVLTSTVTQLSMYLMHSNFRLLWNVKCTNASEYGEYMSVVHCTLYKIHIEIYIYIGYMMPTIWRAYYRCMLILDISCQQFGDKCKLEGFFVPFGHRDGKCIFIEIYIYIGYMLPTIWRAC